MAAAKRTEMEIPDWTQYGREEYIERTAIILQSLDRSSVFRVRRPDQGEFEEETVSWSFALEDIPTQHLMEALTRGIRSHTGTLPYLASDPLREYEAMKEEMAQGVYEARVQPTPTDRGWVLALPPAPEDRARRDAYMGMAEFREAHSLPADWKLGDEYPLDSDLYNAPVPEQRREEVKALSVLLRPQKWHDRGKAPWEIYPDAEHPDVRIVAVRHTFMDPNGFEAVRAERVEYAWWVDRCVEMDFPGVECQGFVLEHNGPAGGWTKRLECPIHAERWQR